MVSDIKNSLNRFNVNLNINDKINELKDICTENKLKNKKKIMKIADQSIRHSGKVRGPTCI